MEKHKPMPDICHMLQMFLKKYAGWVLIKFKGISMNPYGLRALYLGLKPYNMGGTGLLLAAKTKNLIT